MYLIIGLGNPGESYEQTRHNVGFMTVDKLNERYQGTFKKGKGAYVLSKVFINRTAVLLLKPLTYMNLSGQAVQHAARYFDITDLSRLLVILDDFHLPFGTVRLRPSGSAAGQKGLQSIINLMHTNQIPRLRIGIGNEFKNASSFVLSAFNRREQKFLPEIIDHGANAAEQFIQAGIETTMAEFNRNLLDD